MKKELLEEIKRIRFISNYNSEFTSDENKQTLIEQTWKSVIRDESLLRGLMSDIEKVLRTDLKFGGFKTKDLKTLKTADEVIDALRLGKLAPAEEGRFIASLYKNTDNPTILKAISENIVTGETFIKRYGSLNKEAFIRSLKNDRKLTTKQAEELWKANSRRIANTEKKFETTAQQTDDVIEPIDSQRETINPGSQSAQKQTQKVEKEMGPEKSWWDRFFESRKIKDRRKFFGNRQNREKVVQIIKERGGIWDKVFKWGTRTIFFSGLIGIAKLGLFGFGVWWLYDMFKDMDFNFECDDPNDELVYGFGCRKRQGGGSKKEDEEKKKEIKKPDENLKKAQKCLGIEQTGFLDQKTEDALYKKINKRTFDPNDLPKICEKPFSSVEFQI
jgi:hypothetical protein